MLRISGGETRHAGFARVPTAHLERVRLRRSRVVQGGKAALPATG
jgi:hypothetical protein